MNRKLISSPNNRSRWLRALVLLALLGLALSLSGCISAGVRPKSPVTFTENQKTTIIFWITTPGEYEIKEQSIVEDPFGYFKLVESSKAYCEAIDKGPVIKVGAMERVCHATVESIKLPAGESATLRTIWGPKGAPAGHTSWVTLRR